LGCFSGNRIKKIAYFQPLTILEIEAVHKNKGTLENFKEIKSLRLFIPFIRYLQKHHGDVYSEMLHHSIHEGKKRITFTFFRNRITLARQPR
jgi:DNA repair protein RecO (recombination protein O)